MGHNVTFMLEGEDFVPAVPLAPPPHDDPTNHDEEGREKDGAAECRSRLKILPRNKKKMQKVQVAHSKQNTDEGSIPIQTMLMSAGGSTPTVFLTPARPASGGQC